MNYVVYLDIYFCIESVINFVLLCFVERIVKIKTTSLKKMLSAGVGAIISTGCFIYVKNIMLMIIVKYIFSVSVMEYIAFRIKRIKGFLKAVFMGFAISLFINASLNFLYYNTYAGILAGKIINEIVNPNKSMLKFFGISLISYVILEGVIEIILSDGGRNIPGTYYIKIEYKNYELSVKGLYDSGNTLVEPIGKKDVYIVCKNIAGEMCKWGDISKSFMPVSYNSVKGNGILPTIVVDKIKVFDEYNNLIKEVEEPRIGFSENNLSVNGDFQMILNRGLFNTDSL